MRRRRPVEHLAEGFYGDLAAGVQVGGLLVDAVRVRARVRVRVRVRVTGRETTVGLAWV